MKLVYMILVFVAFNFASTVSSAQVRAVNPRKDLGPVKYLVSDKIESYCAIDKKDVLRCRHVCHRLAR